MNLTDAVKIRHPFVWVNTYEPHRVIDELIATDHGRPVIRKDLAEGFVTWSHTDRQWLKLTSHNPADPEAEVTVVDSVSAAILHTIKVGGVLVIHNGHREAEGLSDVFVHVSDLWIQALKADDTTRLPGTLVVTAPNDEKMPIELRRYAAVVDVTLPTKEQVSDLVTTMTTQAKVNTEAIREHLVRASVGLSTTEIFSVAANSLATSGTLDPTFIANERIKIIAARGTMEIREPKITIDQIGGLDLAKDLIESVAWTWDHPDQARSFGVTPIRKVLVIGVPGTGKSAICEAAADRLKLHLVMTGVSKNLSKWVGESESNMRDTFNQIKALAPIVMWIDEFGRDLSGSGSSGDSGVTDRVHGEFLTGLQELPDDVFLMMAANRIDDLPPEMLRAGRIDKFLFVGLPATAERRAILKIHATAAEQEFLDFDRLAERTITFTGAEIKSLLAEVRFKIVTRHQRHVTTDDVIAHIPKVKARIWNNHTDAILDMYRRAVEEWDWASTEQYDDAGQVIDSATKKVKKQAARNVQITQ